MTFSLEVASTVTLPATVALVFWPIQALVRFVITSTSTPAPTPAVPPIAIAPARLRIFVVSLAASATPPLGVARLPIVTWSSMWAVVSFVITFTTTDPATPADSPPAPPTTIAVTSSSCAAVRVSPAGPFAAIVAYGWMAASTTLGRTRTMLDTPTPELVPKAPAPA